MLTNQYTINYKGHILHFGINKWYENYWTLEALDIDGYCFDIIGTSDAHEEGTEASAGCFWSHLGYDRQTSELIDLLIMDGVIRPTGRVLEAFGEPYYIEMQPIGDWMDNLFVTDHADTALKDNEIRVSVTCTCGDRYREALLKHGDYVWTITQYLQFLDRDEGERDYIIDITSKSHRMENEARGFHTKRHHSLVDAWLEAIRIEKAAEEILSCFERVANESGVPVGQLMSAFDICED